MTENIARVTYLADRGLAKGPALKTKCSEGERLQIDTYEQG
jgi:hypothetical protein